MSKKMRFLLAISILMVILAYGIIQFKNTIEKNEEVTEMNVINSLKVEKHDETIHYTDAEIEFIDQLQNKGYITIATRETNTVYKSMSNGNIEGFHYGLVKMFSEHLGVELKVKLVSFNDYFRHNGEIPEGLKTDDSILYKPDLFKEVDIYCDNLTILPWRQKLMTFIELIPVKVLVLTRKGEEIRRSIDLDGKTIVVERNTTYESHFKELEVYHNLNVEYIYLENDEEATKAVANGTADVLAKDSNKAIREVQIYPTLNASLAMGELQFLGWAVDKENKIMASLLRKFFIHARESGEMDTLWKKEYGISLIEYSELLGAIE